MFDTTKEYLKIAVRNLKMRSLRSWLTVFGIVIGVFLIISLLSLSEGVKETVNRQLMSLGGNMIFVTPGSEDNPMSMMSGGNKLEKQDLAAIEDANGVKKILSAAYQAINVRYNEENKALMVEGFSLAEGMEILQKFQGWSLSAGRWPEAGAKEIVVGAKIGQDIFKTPVKPGDVFNIKGKKFEVTGVLNSLGSRADDNSILWTSVFPGLGGTAARYGAIGYGSSGGRRGIQMRWRRK